MRTDNLSITEASLLLHGLRSIFVLDDEVIREKLMEKLTQRLAENGLRLTVPPEGEDVQSIGMMLTVETGSR